MNQGHHLDKGRLTGTNHVFLFSFLIKNLFVLHLSHEARNCSNWQRNGYRSVVCRRSEVQSPAAPLKVLPVGGDMKPDRPRRTTGRLGRKTVLA